MVLVLWYNHLKIVIIDTFLGGIMEEAKDEIENFLKELKENVLKGKVHILKRRDKNKKFLEYYKLETPRIFSMLKELKVEDFNKKELDKNGGKEYVYIFCRNYVLSYYGVEEEKNVYIKILRQKEYLILSLHEAEHNIKYMFK